MIADKVMKPTGSGPIYLMRKTFSHRTIYWAVLLAFGFMLTGKAVACLFPSAMEMGQGNAMDCCADYCRMETNHEAAQKACDQSRLAFSPNETLSSLHNLCNLSVATSQSDINSHPLFSFPMIDPVDRLKQIQNEPRLLRHHQAVQIYTSNESFLI
ncbi:MAG: hypothetical protein ACE5HN_04735 [Nitrospiria bacterium]